MRIPPSVMLVANRPESDGTTWPNWVASNSGTNLYNTMKNPRLPMSVDGHHPGADLYRLLGPARSVLLVLIVERRVGRKLQRIDSQLHGLHQSPQAAEDRQAENRILFRHAVKRLLFGHQLAIGLANSHAIAVRGAHHDAFEHCLAADEDLLAAFEDRQHLDVRRQAQKSRKKHRELHPYYTVHCGNSAFQDRLSALGLATRQIRVAATHGALL